MRHERSFLGRGWAFPPSFTPGGAEVEMVSGAEDIRQSLEVLLQTAPGERVMQETFGCDLASMQFEEIDQELAATVGRLVQSAILEHEPRVQVDGVEVSPDGAAVERVLVSVRYTVRATNSRFNMVLPFYLDGAGPPVTTGRAPVSMGPQAVPNPGPAERGPALPGP
jgi:phage baseplate assembly protein W